MPHFRTTTKVSSRFFEQWEPSPLGVSTDPKWKAVCLIFKVFFKVSHILTGTALPLSGCCLPIFLRKIYLVVYQPQNKWLLRKENIGHDHLIIYKFRRIGQRVLLLFCKSWKIFIPPNAWFAINDLSLERKQLNILSGILIILSNDCIW